MKTQNIIEIVDSEIVSIRSFPFNIKGRKKAAETFVKIANENHGFDSVSANKEMLAKYINTCLSEKRMDVDSGYSLILKEGI